MKFSQISGQLLMCVAVAISLAACQTAAPTQLRHDVLQALPDTLTQTSIAERTTEGPGSDSADVIEINDPRQAQQYALLNSPRIRLIMADLDIQDALYWQQNLLHNPGLGVSLMRPEDGGRWRVGFSVHLSLLDWLAQRQRRELADAERNAWHARTLTVLNDELQDASRHWLQAVAARQKTAVHRELLESASVAADLARLLRLAGNISELEMLSFASVEAQQRQQMTNALLAEQRAISRLKLRLGVPDAAQIQIPASMPAPPGNAHEWLSAQPLPALMNLAEQHQPALELARREIRQREQQVQLTQRRISLRQVGLELETERESSGERYHGLAVTLAPPLFDNGEAEITAIQAEREKAELTLDWQRQQMQAEIRQSLHELHASLTTIQQLEQHDLPRYETMLQLAVQEYNFMLRGSFDLLNIKNHALTARLSNVDALFQYWAALTELTRVVGTDVYLQEFNHD